MGSVGLGWLLRALAVKLGVSSLSWLSGYGLGLCASCLFRDRVWVWVSGGCRVLGRLFLREVEQHFPKAAQNRVA